MFMFVMLFNARTKLNIRKGWSTKQLRNVALFTEYSLKCLTVWFIYIQK